MKKLLLLIFVFFITFQSCKSNKNLYLYFDANNENMIKWKTGKGNPDTYSYNFDNYKINFSSILLNENIKPDTISLNNTKNWKFRNYNWLKDWINKYENLELITFSDHYKYLYIVEVDSLKQKAIVTKVERVFYEE